MQALPEPPFIINPSQVFKYTNRHQCINRVVSHAYGNNNPLIHSLVLTTPIGDNWHLILPDGLKSQSPDDPPAQN